MLLCDFKLCDVNVHVLYENCCDVLYVIDMAGMAWECGVSPTGRFGGDVHIVCIFSLMEVEVE